MKTQKNEALLHYCLYLADSAFIASHRLSEWCGHGPYLEEDLALTNISLDLLGQARYFYEYAEQLSGKDENSLIFTRDENEFRNLLLAELPNGDYAHTIFRQYCFSTIYSLLLKNLSTSKDQTLQGIAQKALLEAYNHISHTEHWITIFLNSTEESLNRLKHAIDIITPYILEAFTPSDFEKKLITQGIAAKLHKQDFIQGLYTLFSNSTIQLPPEEEMNIQHGGKKGEHTEYMGYILTEIQYINNKMPCLQW